jgi:excinuclease ABC subunit C
MDFTTIARKLALAPRDPGVYLFRDAAGQILYVGKAANLRNRVRSYFGSKKGLSTKVVRLVSAIRDVEFVIAGSEQEALVLEADLVRRHKPQYNARLKDDKSFPYLMVDVQNDWPTVVVTRKRTDDGARYFGPFSSARSVRQTLRLIRRVFKFRVCTGPIDGKRSRACLNMHIGLCPGPCVGAISQQEYRRAIDQIVLFLEGRHRDVLDSLVREMKEAAEGLQYEKAALLRDRIHAVDMVTQRHAGVTALRGDQDIVAVAQDGAVTLVEVFSVRDGRALGRQDFPVQGASDLSLSEVVRTFVLQYYGAASQVPPVLLLQHAVADASAIRGWLSDLRGAPVRLVVPQQGIRKQLVDNVADSVARQMVAQKLKSGRGAELRETGLKELKDVLRLSGLPRRIEGFDISNIQGKESVGSMVVFEDGVPRPSEYRRFKIRTVEGQDDYAMMREVLRRRFGRLDGGGVSSGVHGWKAVPSLMLVDGGLGQLGVALDERDAAGLGGIPIVSLAKEFESVYVEGSNRPANLAQDTAGLRMLQAVRDEAHRFAVSYHRSLRDSSAMGSLLDDVDGIGPRRKRALLLAFDNLNEIREASVEDIAVRAGIPVETAYIVKERLAES